MCAPGCVEHVRSKLSRRGFFKGAGAAATAAAAAAWAPGDAEAQAFPRFTRVADLTHTHSPEFPTFFGTPGIALKPLKEFKKDGFNLNEWTVLEHSGTHMDAPIHSPQPALSLDYGASKDFKTHYAWLPSGRWGLECVANLDGVPPRGATLVVGAPKIKGATGGPTRVLALI